MQPIQGFKHFETYHCVTGSLRHLYVFQDYNLSEDMLFGLGEGVGFIYWHMKGQPPFLGGRGNPAPSVEELAGQRTGVLVEPHTTTSARKAESTLVEMLNQGQPVMVQVDMGFLPYFDFNGHEYHFGGHVIVVCGYNAETKNVLVADRDSDLHPVPLDALAKARNSTYKPFPPKNKWYTTDFTNRRAPSANEIYQAICKQTQVMLFPPIGNIGIKGIRKAAQLVPGWADFMNPLELKWASFNAYIFISPVGGTGGGAFRYMFSRFLEECAAITGNPHVADSAAAFKQIADRWAVLGEWFKQASDSPSPADLLPQTADFFNEIAEMEQVAWAGLHEKVS